MKKISKLAILVISVIFLSGCSDIKCKNTYKGNIKYKVTVTADVIDKRVTNAKAVMRFNTEKDANEICTYNKLIGNEKISIVCAYKMVTINGYEYLEMDNNASTISKDQFIKKLKSNGFKC